MSVAAPADAAQAARRVLNSGPMRTGQAALLNALYEAGDEGLTTSELVAILNREEQQINRLFARLARRIRRTRDAAVLQRPGLTLLFDITPDEGEWRYKLRRPARESWAAQNAGSTVDEDESTQDAA